MNRVAFTLLGFPIYWYGLLIALAVVAGVAHASSREGRLGLTRGTTIDFLLLALPIALVCARLYYVVFAWDSFSGNLLSVFNLREGGLAIYGGIIGGLLAAVLFSRHRRIPFRTLADLCAPSLALGQAIGRWGNFFNQEAYGRQLSGAALWRFPVSVYIEADQTWHAATFFYESVCCLIIFIVLISFEAYNIFKKRGDLFGLYLLLYGAERTVIEGLRMDSLMMGSIRVSQLLSAGLVLLVLYTLISRAVKSPKSLICLAAALLLEAVTVIHIITEHQAGLTGAELLIVNLSIIAYLFLSAKSDSSKSGDSESGTIERKQ